MGSSKTILFELKKPCVHCFHTQSLFICKVTTCYRTREPHAKARPGSTKELNAEFTSEIAMFNAKGMGGGGVTAHPKKEVLLCDNSEALNKITALKGFAPPQCNGCDDTRLTEHCLEVSQLWQTKLNGLERVFLSLISEAGNTFLFNHTGFRFVKRHV